MKKSDKKWKKVKNVKKSDELVKKSHKLVKKVTN